jgi:hypothetical protein
MKRSALLMLAALALLSTTAAVVHAQDGPAPALRRYRVTYTLIDMDAGKVTGTHYAALTVVPGSPANLKAGDKIPIMVKGGKTSADSEITYLDIGLSISVSLTEQPHDLLLKSKIEHSFVAPGHTGVDDAPVIRQVVLDNSSTVTPGKSVKIGSLDVLDSTRHTEVEVTVDPNP